MKRTKYKKSLKERALETAENLWEYEKVGLKSFKLYHLLTAGLGAANGFFLARGIKIEELSAFSLASASFYGFLGGIAGTFIGYLENCSYESSLDGNRYSIDADMPGMARDIFLKGGAFAAANFALVGLESLLGAGIGYGIGYLTQ